MLGDRIVAINGNYVENLPHQDVVDLIRDAVDEVNLTLSQAVRSCNAFMSNKSEHHDNLKNQQHNSRVFIGKKSITRPQSSAQNVKSNSSTKVEACPLNPLAISCVQSTKFGNCYDQGRIMATNTLSKSTEKLCDFNLRNRNMTEICPPHWRSTEVRLFDYI